MTPEENDAAVLCILVDRVDHLVGIYDGSVSDIMEREMGGNKDRDVFGSCPEERFEIIDLIVGVSAAAVVPRYGAHTIDKIAGVIFRTDR